MENQDHGKKLMAVFCSPHEQGCTRQLLDSFLKGFREIDGWDIQEWDAYEMAAKPCIGCGYCAGREGCVFPDLDSFDRALRESDLLVVASPVYNASFPAPFKAILDRSQRYFEARFSLGKRPPVKKRRDAVLLLSMGSREEFAVQIATYQLRRAFSVMNTILAHWVVWKNTDQGGGNRDAALNRAGAIAQEYWGLG